MSKELAAITDESELIAFLQSVRASIDEGLTNLGADPDDDVVGFAYQAAKIGMPGLIAARMVIAGRAPTIGGMTCAAIECCQEMSRIAPGSGCTIMTRRTRSQNAVMIEPGRQPALA